MSVTDTPWYEEDFYSTVTTPNGVEVQCHGTRLDAISDAAQEHIRTGRCPFIIDGNTGKRDRRADCEALQLSATLKASASAAGVSND